MLKYVLVFLVLLVLMPVVFPVNSNSSSFAMNIRESAVAGNSSSSGFVLPRLVESQPSVGLKNSSTFEGYLGALPYFVVPVAPALLGIGGGVVEITSRIIPSGGFVWLDLVFFVVLAVLIIILVARRRKKKEVKEE